MSENIKYIKNVEKKILKIQSNIAWYTNILEKEKKSLRSWLLRLEELRELTKGQ